jgi:Domain of unknown function (DUF1707)
MTDGEIRASDDDRESAVTVLRDAYTEGRLTLDEFDERTAAAYSAKTWGDLRGLTTDLPVQPSFGGSPPDSPSTRDLPRLAPVRTEAMPPQLSRSQLSQSRRKSAGPLLPIVFTLAVIAGATGNPSTAAALSCLFICLLAARIATSGRW